MRAYMRNGPGGACIRFVFVLNRSSGRAEETTASTSETNTVISDRIMDSQLLSGRLYDERKITTHSKRTQTSPVGGGFVAVGLT